MYKCPKCGNEMSTIHLKNYTTIVMCLKCDTKVSDGSGGSDKADSCGAGFNSLEFIVDKD